MRYFVLAGLTALLCAAQTAPLPSLPAGECGWEGFVEDPLAHKPINNAVVSFSIREPGSARDQYVSHATSDSKGYWKISNVVCKSPIVNAEKPGYIRWPPRPSVINVAVRTPSAGLQPIPVRIQLTLASALASISGSVLDEAGKPIPTAQIKLASISPGNGRRTRQESPLTVPDNKGAFSASQLAPGANEVCAVSEPGPADGPWTHYSASCSPGPARGERKQINFVLRRIAGVHVRGKVTGCAAASCSISLKRFDAVTNTTTKQDIASGNDGSFDFAGIPPGPYSLSASGSGMTAYLPITIADADVASLELKLAAAVDVRGTVRYPADFSATTPPDISLKSLSPLSARAGGVEWNAEHTSFVFQGVEPGRYEFSFRVRNAFPQSAMLNGNDIVDSEFHVESGMPSIDVTVDDKLAGVEGTTVNAQGDSMNSAVYLMQGGRKPIIGYSNFGAFVGRIPPGEYSAYAFPSGAPVYYLEPDWMAQYGRDPQRVTVSVDRVVRIRLVERTVEDQ